MPFSPLFQHKNSNVIYVINLTSSGILSLVDLLTTQLSHECEDGCGILFLGGGIQPTGTLGTTFATHRSSQNDFVNSIMIAYNCYS